MSSTCSSSRARRAGTAGRARRASLRRGGRLRVDRQRTRQRRRRRGSPCGSWRPAAGAQLWTAAYDDALDARAAARRCRSGSRATSPRSPPRTARSSKPSWLARGVRAQAPKLRDCLVTYYDYRRRKSSGAYSRTRCECFRERQRAAARRRAGLGRAGDAVRRRLRREVRPRRRRCARGRARPRRAKALMLDPDDFLANLALTRVQFFDGDPAFRQTIDRTLALRPDSAQALAQGGFLLAVTRRLRAGLPLIQQGARRYRRRRPRSQPRVRRHVSARAAVSPKRWRRPEDRRAELGRGASRRCGGRCARRARRRRARSRERVCASSIRSSKPRRSPISSAGTSIRPSTRCS